MFINDWNIELTKMIQNVHKPKYIFAEGLKLQRWFDNNKNLAPISHKTVIEKCYTKSKDKFFRIHETSFNNETKMFYIDNSLHYISRFWKDDGLNFIYETLKPKIKQLFCFRAVLFL